MNARGMRIVSTIIFIKIKIQLEEEICPVTICIGTCVFMGFEIRYAVIRY